jgi:putative nucleotidyltransferase with HDIG domain
MLSINSFLRIFDEYAFSFLNEPNNSENTRLNLELKITHTKNVLDNCSNIAVSENLSAQDTLTAQLCGLFHDIGRFEQFTKFQTFRDDDSLYHGKIGVDVLDKECFLARLPTDIQDIIISAVYNHGLIKIPIETSGKSYYFSKLVRDADKIDIYRIVAKYYNSIGPRNIALEYGLEDKPYISESIITKFTNHQLIEKMELNTLNDFKTMQLAWIFDINFTYTRRTIIENNYLDAILLSISNIEQREVLRELIKLW